MKNKSNLVHSFAKTPSISTPRSVFDRSHTYKTCFDAGFLIPVIADEIIPGDEFKVHSTYLIRILSALHRPVMDNLYMDTFTFFVPNRIIQDNWQKLMGAQDDPGDSISFLVPTVTSPNVAAGGIAVGHLYDYMGLPTGPLDNGGTETTGITFNNLHGRAYNLIWNEFFRDQNLQDSVVVDKDDGPDTYTDYNLLKRGKRHDFFTSALPFLQKGTAISLPLGTSAPVIGETASTYPTFTDGVTVNNLTMTNGTKTAQWGVNAGATDNAFWQDPGLYADLSSATSATINSLRESIATQQLLERDARGGTRYSELLKSQYGVSSPLDAVLQRPQLLHTSSAPIKINPVAQTSSTDIQSYQGNMAAFGTGADGAGWRSAFTEHGVLLTLLSVRADQTYQRGIDKMWSRQTRYDFFFPALANLGEQEILNKEIWADLDDGTGASDKDGVWGYIPRWDDYRFKISKITGILNSYASGTIDVWHLSQEYTSLPTLGDTFIQEDPPIDRIIGIPSEPHFILDAFHDMKCARVMPVNSVPGLLKL